MFTVAASATTAILDCPPLLVASRGREVVHAFGVIVGYFDRAENAYAIKLAGKPQQSLSVASLEISITYSLQIGQNVTSQSSDSRAAHAQKALVPIGEK